MLWLFTGENKSQWDFLIWALHFFLLNYRYLWVFPKDYKTASESERTERWRGMKYEWVRACAGQEGKMERRKTR